MTKNEIAKHIFARNPEVQKLFITSDGQAFYEEHQAEGHAGRLKVQKVETFEKEAKMEVVQDQKADAAKAAQAQKEQEAADAKAAEILKAFPFLETVKKASAQIKTIKTIEELDAIAEAEKEYEARKGVESAIADRRAELTETKTEKTE